MTTFQVGYFVGSLSQNSINRTLSKALVRLAPEDLAFTEIRIDNLPLYSPDYDTNYPPEAVVLKEAIARAQAVLFVTPEYNRSMPGVLKNALDHASRPYGDSAWAEKPAGVLGVSVGAQGTAMAQQHLRNVLAYLDMPTMGQPEAFIHYTDGSLNEDGTAGEKLAPFLGKWLAAYLKWVERHSG